MTLKFKTRLKELRLENKLTQKDLADMLNINRSAVAKWELGEIEPSLKMLLKICAALDTSADYLLGIKNN